MKFNTLSVASLEPRSTTFTVRDSSRVGFALKVSPQGCKTFLYICKTSGKTLQTSLGRFPATSVDDASIQYLIIKNGGGLSPKEPSRSSELGERSSELTIEDAWREYDRTEGKIHLSLTVRKQYGNFISEFISHHGNICMSALDAGLVKKHLRLFKKFKTKPNKVKAAISCLCKYLVEQDILVSNPTIGLPTKKSKPKTRKLSTAELAAFLPALKSSNIEDHNKDAIRLIFLTLGRVSEVIHMDVSELDLDAGRWVLPAERSKNGEEHLITLSTQAVDLLRLRTDTLKGTKVFYSPTGHPSSRYSVRQAIKRLCGTIGIPATSTHDIRRTAAHHINSLGIQSDLIAKLMNHAATGVTSTVYIQAGLFDAESEKRAALQLWSESLIQRGF